MSVSVGVSRIAKLGPAPILAGTPVSALPGAPRGTADSPGEDVRASELLRSSQRHSEKGEHGVGTQAGKEEEEGEECEDEGGESGGVSREPHVTPQHPPPPLQRPRGTSEKLAVNYSRKLTHETPPPSAADTHTLHATTRDNTSGNVPRGDMQTLTVMDPKRSSRSSGRRAALLSRSSEHLPTHTPAAREPLSRKSFGFSLTDITKDRTIRFPIGRRQASPTASTSTGTPKKDEGDEDSQYGFASWSAGQSVDTSPPQRRTGLSGILTTPRLARKVPDRTLKESSTALQDNAKKTNTSNSGQSHSVSTPSTTATTPALVPWKPPSFHRPLVPITVPRVKTGTRRISFRMPPKDPRHDEEEERDEDR